MHPIPSRRALAAALAATTLLAACGARGARTTRDAREPASIVLDVQNHGYFDLAVYAVQAGAGSGARLGLVPGTTRALLAVRRADLQTGSQLVLRLHAIGTRREWVSPAVTVGDGMVAQLDVFMDADGGMSRSTLQTGPAVMAARSVVAARAP